MNRSFSPTSRMLMISIAFSLSLIIVRFWYSDTFAYRFYAWNIFLAVIPYVASVRLRKSHSFRINEGALLFLWLLFFPNAPYLITDLFHYEERPPVPFWYDVLLVTSATWNGLVLAMASLMNVELFLSRHLKKIWVTISIVFSMLLCSYGIFLGRFLRFNSWDILSDPAQLTYTSAKHVLRPQQYPKLWVFTLLFTIFLLIIYYSLKTLHPDIEKLRTKKDPP
jgi:uncharacterized membrane protein